MLYGNGLALKLCTRAKEFLLSQFGNIWARSEAVGPPKAPRHRNVTEMSQLFLCSFTGATIERTSSLIALIPLYWCHELSSTVKRPLRVASWVSRLGQPWECAIHLLCSTAMVSLSNCAREQRKSFSVNSATFGLVRKQFKVRKRPVTEMSQKCHNFFFLRLRAL